MKANVKYTEVLCKIHFRDDGSAKVEVELTSNMPEHLHLWSLLPAAEYLTHLVATESSLGYEGALESIAKGAKTWGAIERDRGQT